MKYDVGEIGVEETLRHAIANIYYYLELYDKEHEEDETLLFKYVILLNEREYSIAVLSHEDDNEGLEKYVKKQLEYKLQINTLRLVSYEAKHMIRQPLMRVDCVVELTRKEYLCCIYNRLCSIVPMVDYYCDRHEVCLEGVAQEYGLQPWGLLMPVDCPDENEVFDPFKNSY